MFNNLIVGVGFALIFLFLYWLRSRGASEGLVLKSLKVRLLVFGLAFVLGEAYLTEHQGYSENRETIACNLLCQDPLRRLRILSSEGQEDWGTADGVHHREKRRKGENQNSNEIRHDQMPFICSTCSYPN